MSRFKTHGQELKEQMDENKDVRGVKKFGNNSWPSANEVDFLVDDDGWNVYSDQTGGDWYSFVENQTPPQLTIAAITDYFEDNHRDEDEVPRHFFQESRLEEALTPVQEEKAPSARALQHKSSPTAKLRSSLSRLSCFTAAPEKYDQIVCSPPMRLGAIDQRLAPTYDGDDDGRKVRLGTSSWMHKANLNKTMSLVSVQELDHYCGAQTYFTNRNQEFGGTVMSDDGSCSSSGTRNASSVANCTIDSNLAKALDFHFTPEKKRQMTARTGAMTDFDRKTQPSGEGGTKVAERRKWLVEAFQKPSASRDDSDVTTTTSSSSSVQLADKINKFGGRKKTAMQVRKEEWEEKFAQKLAEKQMTGRPKLTFKNKWECNNGCYRQRKVLVRTAAE